MLLFFRLFVYQISDIFVWLKIFSFVGIINNWFASTVSKMMMLRLWCFYLRLKDRHYWWDNQQTEWSVVWLSGSISEFNMTGITYFVWYRWDFETKFCCFHLRNMWVGVKCILCTLCILACVHPSIADFGFSFIFNFMGVTEPLVFHYFFVLTNLFL